MAAAQDAVASHAGPATREEARAAIDAVLGGAEFGRTETWLDQGQRWLREFLASLFPDLAPSGAALSTLAQVLTWVLVVLAAAIVVVAVVRAIRARRRDAIEMREEAPRLETRAERVARLRAEAAAADARGDHVLALRLSFTALVCALGERGDLEYRDAFTNRELLERGRPGREAETILRPLVPELDAKSFGDERATHADYVRLAGLCDRFAGGAAQ
jgi:hypothetical protein